jgi:hypothetical protein
MSDTVVSEDDIAIIMSQVQIDRAAAISALEEHRYQVSFALSAAVSYPLPPPKSNVVDALLALFESAPNSYGADAAVEETKQCDADSNAALSDATAAAPLPPSAAEPQTCYLQHVKTGMFIQPLGRNAVIDCPLVMHSPLAASSALFCFRPDGNIQHAESGYFVCPLQRPAERAVPLALHPDGPKPDWAFEINDAGCLRHASSGLFVHPISGKGVLGCKLMFHPDGPDRAFPGEIAFRFEPKSSGDLFAKAFAEANAAAEAESASTLFCDAVESLWASVLCRDGSSDSAACAAVQRVLLSEPLNKSKIVPHRIVPVQLFKLLTESALDLTLPSTNQSAATTRIVECVLKSVLLKNLALRLQCEHLLQALFDPTQEYVSEQHLRDACSGERARPASFFSSWTIRTAMQRDRGRKTVCQPAELISHLRTDSFSAELSRRFSIIDSFSIFVPDMFASVGWVPSCLPAIFCLVPFTINISSFSLDSDVTLGELTPRGALHKCASMSPSTLKHALEAFGFCDSDFDCSLADAALVVEFTAKISIEARKQFLRSVTRRAVDSRYLVTCRVCFDWFLRRHTVIPCKSRCRCA